MAITSCGECKGKVSDKALFCPHCGFGLAQALEELVQRHVQKAVQAGLPRQEAALPFDERRRHKRIEIKSMIQVNGETALISNISRSGMKLSSPQPPKLPEIDIILDNDEKVMRLKGRICWVSGRRTFSNLVDFGVEITAAPPEYYALIDRL
jgi:hypothetical protein